MRNEVIEVLDMLRGLKEHNNERFYAILEEIKELHSKREIEQC